MLHSQNNITDSPKPLLVWFLLKLAYHIDDVSYRGTQSHVRVKWVKKVDESNQKSDIGATVANEIDQVSFWLSMKTDSQANVYDGHVFE